MASQVKSFHPSQKKNRISSVWNWLHSGACGQWKKTFCQDLCSIKGLALHQTMANMPLVINPSNIKVMLENTRRQKSGEKNGTTQRLIADDMSQFSCITNSYLCNMQATVGYHQ